MKTIYLRHPVNLRTREEDPNGVAPLDITGQPARNRDGSIAKAFVIKEQHLKRGMNIVDDAVAAHPHIVASMIDAPRGAADDFTVEQLEAMLAEKRAKALKGGDRKDGAKGDKGGDDEKRDPLPWPSDDMIQAMKPNELRGLLATRGGNPQGVKNDDLLAAVIDLKAAQAAQQ